MGGKLSRLKEFPRKELWRLFIDGYRQKEGMLSFDKGSDFHKAEPGYIVTMLKAFSFATKHLTTKISVDFIQKCHAKSTTGLDVSYRDKEGNLFDYSFRAGPICCRYFRYANTASRDGLKELLERIYTQIEKYGESLYGILPLSVWEAKKFSAQEYAKNYKEFWTSSKKSFIEEILNNASDPYMLVQFSPKDDSFIPNVLETYIDAYYLKQRSAHEDDHKITNIVRFIQDCEQLHPFIDGNCRTFCMILVNFLLLQNNLQMTVLYDPNRFDGFSEKELLEDVKTGINVTRNLIETGSCVYDF